MILVDSRIGSVELCAPLTSLGLTVEKTALEFGDVAFEGQGPDGSILVGVERKRLHDMLSCIDDARYTGHQRIGMADLYRVSVLIVEGVWRPHDPQMTLMEGFNGSGWRECRYRTQRVMYSKLRRYLFSVSLSGVLVLTSRDVFQTAADIHELYHYFQKGWHQHTSLLEMQKLNIPTLRRKPSLVRKWAADIEGVGVTLSERAERLFRTPITLATADEVAWMQLPGVGAVTAQKIVREIQGRR